MEKGELGKKYGNGDFLFKEGEHSDVMYVVQSGKVNIIKDTSKGTVTIATIKPGEVIGEMSLFDNLPRSAGAVVDGDARVLSIDRKKLFTTISKDPTLAFKIIETMSRRVRALNDEIVRMNRYKREVLESFFNVDDICDYVLKELKQILSPENASVMLASADRETLSIAAAFGIEAETKAQLRKGDGIAGKVLESGKAELVNKVAADQRYKSGGLDVTSLLCVPLAYENDIFGVINASNTSETLFTVDDLNKARSFSSWASIAIQNALCCSKLMSVSDDIMQQATMLDRG